MRERAEEESDDEDYELLQPPEDESDDELDNKKSEPEVLEELAQELKELEEEERTHGIVFEPDISENEDDSDSESEDEEVINKRKKMKLRSGKAFWHNGVKMRPNICKNGK